MKKTINVYVWKKAFNQDGTYYYTKYWEYFFKYLNTNDIKNFFIGDKDIKKYNYSAATSEWYNCKMLTFKVPKKEIPTFSINLSIFKSSLDKYFIFRD